MFNFTKIFSLLILPPGIVLLALFVTIILVLFNRRKGALLFLIAITLCLGGLSMTPVADFLIAPLETASPALDLEKVKAETDDIQYVVVLGGGMVDRSPEEGMKGSLSDEAIKRTMYGIRIAKLFNKPLIYSGGRVFPMAGIDAEADAAKRFMEESNEGVTVLYENASRTTWENAKAVSAAYKPKEILLVTSAYHMPRALVAFKKAGINPIPAPTDYKPNRSTYIWEDYFPNLLALHNSCLAFHEYFGLVFYIVRPRG